MQETEAAANLPLDAALEALADRTRRRLLVALLERAPAGETLRLPADVEFDHAGSTNLRVQLWHCHLPKLASAGFVEWSPEPGTVRRGPRFEEVESVLRALYTRADEVPEGLPGTTPPTNGDR